MDKKSINAKNTPKKRKKWIKLRHSIVCFILKCTVGVYGKIKYHVKVKKLGERKERQYLVLFNHQTAFDQFFVSMSFKRHLYYLASEDIFSSGFTSALIRYLAAPIPIKKQANDMNAVLTCMRVAKEGGSIALAPEGNRTYSGKTEYIKPSIVQLIRALKIPVAFYRIEGGFGTHPRWSDNVRRGKMQTYVSKILEVDDIAKLNDEELLRIVKEELYVNEGVKDFEYTSNAQAEYLERAIYVCPQHGLSEFESNGDLITCKQCGMKVKYLPSKELIGIGFDFPFKFVTEWYDYQSEFIKKLDLLPCADTPLYKETASFAEVLPYKKKILLEENASIALYGNRFEICGENIEKTVFPFDDCSATAILGKNKVNIYHKGRVYQIKGDKRFCGLKYVNIYYRYKNQINPEGTNEQFLGI